MLVSRSDWLVGLYGLHCCILLAWQGVNVCEQAQINEKFSGKSTQWLRWLLVLGYSLFRVLCDSWLTNPSCKYWSDQWLNWRRNFAGNFYVWCLESCRALNFAVVFQDTPEYLHLAAAGNVTLHLNKLLKENVVGKCPGCKHFFSLHDKAHQWLLHCVSAGVRLGQQLIIVIINTS